MAASKRNASKPDDPRQARTREAIQTTRLVNRLQDFVLGGTDPKTGDPIEIDSRRLKAIEILLRKTLPDMSNVQQDITHNTADPLTTLLEQIGENPKRITDR